MKNIKIVILILIAFSCLAQKSDIQNQSPVNKKITFNLQKKGETIWLNAFSDIFEDATLLTFDPNNTKPKSIAIQSTLEVNAGNFISYNNFYLLNPGDSVDVDFIKLVPTYLLKNKALKFGSPYLVVKNRRANPYELNFCYYLNLNNRLGINMYQFELRKRNYALERLPPIISPKESYLLSVRYLDSLMQANLLSSAAYPIYRDYLQSTYYDVLLKLKQSVNPIEKSYLEKSDLLKYNFYRSFLHLYIERSLIKQPNLDYEQAYVISKENFKGKIQEYLLTYYLLKIKEYKPGVFASYLLKFSSDVKNVDYMTYVNKNFNNKLLNTNASKSYIFNSEGRKNLSEYTKGFKGNWIYVDIWASWCVPCRETMPASKRLRKDYAGKKISFLYLSIDDKLTSWEAANKQEGLDSYNNSFLLLNVKNDLFLKQLNLKTIPRYLIYNKNGELLNANAPAPDDPKLKELLNQYLSK